MASLVFAAPPPDADPATSGWFQSLKTKDGGSCCSESDCRRTSYKLTHDGIVALTPEGEWVAVPTPTILPRTDNPTGFGILCWNGERVLCFVRAAEG